MEIRTLEHTPLARITAAFNEAFSDYFIKLSFTEESMAAKMKGEGIVPAYSVGAFEGSRLVGFILHAYDVIDGVRTIYNAGTGVIPAFRGKGLTSEMYQYSIPLLSSQGIHTHVLEVIEGNYPAIKAYQRTGFQTVRHLKAYKSTEPVRSEMEVRIEIIGAIPTEVLSFCSVEAAWQNGVASIARDIEGHSLLAAYSADTLVAFAACVPATGRVKLCVVHPSYRRKGIGTALFAYMMEHSATGALVLTNIDTSYEPATAFLKALQFQPFLGQYEMKMQVV